MQKVNLVMVNKYHGLTAWIFEDTMLVLVSLLKDAGYDAQITANFIDPQAVNILFGVGSAYSHPFAEIAQIAGLHNTIIFNGEQVESHSSLITDEYLEFLSRYVVMDWCQPNVDAIARRVPHARAILEVPLFPTANLATVEPRDWRIEYDLGFYGHMAERRKAICAELEQEGIRIKHITKAYGNHLSEHLLDCRYILNLHAYETDLLEINRCLRPMSMGIPVISEVSTLPGSGDWDDCGIVFLPREGFAQGVKRILADPGHCLVASRKAVQFTHRADNAVRIRAVMEKALAALAATPGHA